MTYTSIAKWQSQVHRAAKAVAGKWPGIVYIEDTAQDINVWLMENQTQTEKLAELPEHERYNLLCKIGHNIAAGKRASYEYFSGFFRYSVDEVRRCLSSGVLRATDTGIESSWNAEKYVTSSSGETNQVLSVISTQQDLINALESMSDRSPKYYEVVHRRYLSNEALDSTDHGVLTKALLSLTNRMNHSHKRSHDGEMAPCKTLGDGPGSRKAIRNSAARYLSKEGWDADYIPSVSGSRDNRHEPEVWE